MKEWFPWKPLLLAHSAVIIGAWDSMGLAWLHALGIVNDYLGHVGLTERVGGVLDDLVSMLLLLLGKDGVD